MRYVSDQYQEAFKSLNKAIELIGCLRTQGLLNTNLSMPRDEKTGHFKLTSGNSNSPEIFASLFKETPSHKAIIWIILPQKAFSYSEKSRFIVSTIEPRQKPSKIYLKNWDILKAWRVSLSY